MADPNRSWSKDSAANTPDSELSDQEIDNMPIGAEDRLVEKVTRVVRPESSPAEDDSLATDSVVEGPGPEILEDWPEDTEEIDLIHLRISDLSILPFDRFKNLQRICFRQNMIIDITGLDSLKDLTELDLYDNKISHIQGLDNLTELRSLDLSFNKIKHVKNLSHLHKLEEVFLVSNKISSVDGLQSLTQLTNLELGANRFRTIEHLDAFVNLQQLWLGKNKITKLENLSPLKNLRLLSIQSNRLTKLEGLEELLNLEELYVSHNLIEKLEGLDNNTKLRTLDIANNKVSKLENISHLTMLEEFWANSNLLTTETFNDLEVQLKDKSHLETVYLEGNPMQKDNRATYRNKIRLALPQIKQIDATSSSSSPLCDPSKLSMDFVSIAPHSFTYIFAIGMILAFFDAFGIGANDVANSFASSVGSKTLTLFQACCIAVFTEFLGAFLMGSSTADTIRGNIISLDDFANQPGTLMLAMLCAIAGAATWVLIACRMGWPVSTTHSVVGAMIGVGVAGFGFSSVDWTWTGIGSIIASWVISPICSGLVCAFLILITQQLVLKSENSFSRGLIALPFYFFVTLAINVFYIVFKGSPGLSLSKLPLGTVFGISFGISGAVFLWTWFFLKPFLKRRLGDGENLKWYHVFVTPFVSKRESAQTLESAQNTIAEGGASPDEKGGHHEEFIDAENIPLPEDEEIKKDNFIVKGFKMFKAKMDRGIDDGLDQDDKLREIHANAQKYDDKTERLFSFLQVITACFCSFAHGSNDVANAVGPISTIYSIWETGTVASTKSTIPWWILLYGGVGIDVGLVVYGYRTMSTLGHKITYLSPSRGFAVELGTALTVLTCSKLGLPVSTTHCVTGATAAVGLMNKNGYKTLNWKALGLVFSSWVLTLPAAALMSGLLFAFVGNSPQIIH